MRGRPADESELAQFVSARTAELHRTAYLLTGDQDRAERLVATAVDRLRRDGTPLSQAGGAARSYMAHLAAAATEPIGTSADDAPLPADERRAAIAGMSPRQRAVLMLRSLDRLDERSTARELGIPSTAVAGAETEASSALGAATDSVQCRTALNDFAERATWPNPSATLVAAAHVSPPRRHSRRRYVAVAAVLVIGAAAPIAAQVQHDRWLRTPEGINASHGTHFHAYTQGFKLVGVQRIPANTSRAVVSTSAREAIALGCAHFTTTSQAGWPRIDDGAGDGPEPFACAQQSAKRYFLRAAAGKTIVTATRAGHQEIAVARYESVAWDRYPVAQKDFEIQEDQTLSSLLKNRVGPQPAAASGRTVTMTGTNGVFTGRVRLPAPADGTELYLTGLLSPTSTGRYKITVDGERQLHCGALNDDPDTWCELGDHYVPQLPIYSGWSATAPGPASRRGSAVVRVEARDAHGPWKLQLQYSRYRYAN